VPDNARICPDGTAVGGVYVLSNHKCVLTYPCDMPTGCEQGAVCSPNTGCGTTPEWSDGCVTQCTCDATSHFDCTVTCYPAPPPLEAGPPIAVDAGPPVVVDAGPPGVPDPCPGYVVPDICQVCTNGVVECAHAVLANGKCQTEICP
jgi:hypothetical protein